MRSADYWAAQIDGDRSLLGRQDRALVRAIQADALSWAASECVDSRRAAIHRSPEWWMADGCANRILAKLRELEAAK